VQITAMADQACGVPKTQKHLYVKLINAWIKEYPYNQGFLSTTIH